MQTNTTLFYVDSRPQYGEFIQAEYSHWELWFSEDPNNPVMPLVIDHEFPVKPTKRQIRKLRRAFRKESKMWAESEWVIDPFDVYEPHELPKR